MTTKMKKWMDPAVVLVAGMVLSVPAFASMPERPRQQDYPTFSQYMQALYEYHRQEIATQDPKAGLCSDTSESGGQGDKQKNECAKRAEILNKPLLDTGTPHEDLDTAIARATAGINPGYVDNSPTPHTTFNSFPLAPISSLDLSKTGVNGLLGFFGALIPANQIAPGTTAALRADSPLVLTPDVGVRLSSDDASSVMAVIDAGAISFGGLLHLRGGTGSVVATAAPTATGTSLTLSSDVTTGLYIVDRDGEPGTLYNYAGAMVVDSVGINVKDVHADISATTSGTAGSNSVLNTTIYSPNAVTVDLSGTHIGAADALVDGSDIGTTTNFVSFGANSVLTVAPGMSMVVTLGRPSGLQTPLITLNGTVGTVSLADIALTDRANTILHLGQFGITGLNLVNTQIFIDQTKVLVDLGSGMKNVGVALERVSLGNDPINGSLGDFYISHMNINHLAISVQPH